ATRFSPCAVRPDRIATNGGSCDCFVCVRISADDSVRGAPGRRRDSLPCKDRRSMTAIHVIGVFFLIGVNGFFAATEFSLVAVRLSRVRQLVEKGDPRAKIVEQLIGDLGRVVSGVQVGLSVASLALGYLGEITLATILRPLVERMVRPWAPIVTHAVAIVLVFGLLTFLQVVFGELVPKSLSLARAERVALLVARPFHWFLNTFSWAIDLLDGTAERI